MPTQRYSVTPHAVDTLLAWVRSGEIAIPEIQRPFVWSATQVRNLLDSMYQGYPIGYLIAWRNPTIKLKDGTSAAGKRILIDGQQRVTALMAALLGREVLNKDYQTLRIRIGFNPQAERFEVANPAISGNPAWIADVAEVFAQGAGIISQVNAYIARNPDCDPNHVGQVVERLRAITNNHVGVIELDDDLDIETVTKIFIRVNSTGVSLSQADFAMSKIAVNEAFGGNMLRKAIDYFCHATVEPDFLSRIEKADSAFASSKFLPKMRWLQTTKDDIYDPTYTDMLRVAFTTEFGRGRLQDLVALLSGRNFETKQYEEAIAEESFAKLHDGVFAFISQTHFERLTMILRSAGFVSSSLIRGRNAVNSAYIVYLRGRKEGVPPARLEQLVRKWYAMSILTKRFGGNPETQFDVDVRQVQARGLAAYVQAVLDSELADSFWTGLLPQSMETSSSSSPYFMAYQAAQVKQQDKGFLSRDISVQDLLLNRSDAHHVYPQKHLKDQGLARGRYNQIANFVLAQSEINIAIGAKAPVRYFAQLGEQCSRGSVSYGGITDSASMRENLRAHCIPLGMLDGDVPSYDDFLEQRRYLMALKLKQWFEVL